jgi:GxxExxY protein
MIDEELTGRVIKVYYKIYNALGYGFIESIYHNSMIIELVRAGMTIETEKPIAVHYESNVVGTFSADLVVEGKLILELKAKEVLSSAHEAQLTNYLRATDIELGLLLNVGREPEFKRKYFSNGKKRRPTNLLDGNILKTLFKKDPPKSAQSARSAFKKSVPALDPAVLFTGTPIPVLVDTSIDPGSPRLARISFPLPRGACPSLAAGWFPSTALASTLRTCPSQAGL